MIEDPFEKLARLINESHEDLAMRIDTTDSKLSALSAGLDELKTEVRDGFRDIRRELSEISKRLDSLEERTASNAGFAKEIDFLRSEIAAIKKHLKLTEGR